MLESATATVVYQFQFSVAVVICWLPGWRLWLMLLLHEIGLCGVGMWMCVQSAVLPEWIVVVGIHARPALQWENIVSCTTFVNSRLTEYEPISLFVRPSSHRTRSTSQQAYQNFGTHNSQWECSYSLQATSKDLHTNLHANLLTRPVWTGP